MGKINLQTRLQRVACVDKDLYVTSPVRYSTITWEDVVKYAAENSGVPKAQVASFSYAILQQVEQFVLNGHSLEFGTMGTWYLSARAKAAETEDQAGSDAVERISLKFRQSGRMRDLLNSSVTLNTLKKVVGGDEGTESGSDTEEPDNDDETTDDPLA